MLETLVWTALLLVVVLASFLLRRQYSGLAKAIFGAGYRVRYIPKQYVLEGTTDGRAVKYSTRGLHFDGRALTYLFIEAAVSDEASVTSDSESVNLQPQLKPAIAMLQKADGFDRLDLISNRISPLHTVGVVSWLHPGSGIMLRRNTKHDRDPQFLKNDIAVLLKMADLLDKPQRRST